jgi:porin
MNRTTYAGVALRLAAILLALTALPPVLRADEAKPWLTLVNVADALSNVQGGIRPGTRYLDKLDLSTPRIGDALGWTRTEVFLDVQGTTASNFNALTGSTQGISNIDAPAGVRVLDAWIAQNLGATGRIKAGIVDFNSEFDLQPTGTLFLNPSHGIGPDISRTGFNGPSIFPSTGLGLVGQWNPGQAWELKSGIFQGQPGNPNHPGRSELNLSGHGGALFAFEARNHVTSDFIVGGGTWIYTAAFNCLDKTCHSYGNSGFYGIADGLLWGSAQRGLSGWLRTGTANSTINPLAFYLGGGLVFHGPWNRDSDKIGVAVGHVRFGALAKDMAQASGTPLTGETALELTYSLAVRDNLSLQPDLQYVFSPGGVSSIPNAMVAGLRITLSGGY